jgi:GNAT superfamily N-acetyltransferase
LNALDTRRAEPGDLDGLTRLLTEAFRNDPIWGWAFPEEAGLEAWWRLYVGSALRYPWVWIAGDFAAAAMWIPPGGDELTDEEQAQVAPLVHALVGERAADVLALVDRFEEAHPRSEPHYYLSLLGTADRHRGKGIGMALLAESLAEIDRQGMAAYLESSNPANDRRYARAGFAPVGEFTTPDGARTVTTMWRDAARA